MATYYINSYDELNSIEAKIGDIAVLVGKASFQAISTVVSNDSGTMQIHSRAEVWSRAGCKKLKAYFPPQKGRGGKIKRW